MLPKAEQTKKRRRRKPSSDEEGALTLVLKVTILRHCGEFSFYFDVSSNVTSDLLQGVQYSRLTIH